MRAAFGDAACPGRRAPNRRVQSPPRRSREPNARNVIAVRVTAVTIIVGAAPIPARPVPAAGRAPRALRLRRVSGIGTGTNARRTALHPEHHASAPPVAEFGSITTTTRCCLTAGATAPVARAEF
ncbi:MAG TPA: hypothetical protein VFJ74_14890 [Gemmatimonadaceae bacterium]|nr:hypothetical protein [Gemmatimonadaceae bacterium]